MSMYVNMHDRERSITPMRASEGEFVFVEIQEKKDRNAVTLFFDNDDQFLDFANRMVVAAKWLKNDPRKQEAEEKKHSKERREAMKKAQVRRIRKLAKKFGLIPAENLDAPEGVTEYALFDPEDLQNPVAVGGDFIALKNMLLKRVDDCE